MSQFVIMVGAPGAGKGTQAERLAVREGLPHLSTGDLLRAAAVRGTALGQVARAVIDGGHFVDDATMIALVTERLRQPDCAGGCVLDGFPRTVAQGRATEAMLAARGTVTVVHLEVPEDELVRRLTTRLVCLACGRNKDPEQQADEACGRCGGRFGRRADDGADVIAERMRVFAAETEPLVARFRERPGYFPVDGHKPAAQVADAIGTVIGRLVLAAAGSEARA